MKREDIRYFNSWAKSFKNCSPAKVMQALLDGIWIASNKDPEDIYRVYPKLVVEPFGGSPENDKKLGLCPFEFSIEDGETYKWRKEGKELYYKSRSVNSFGDTWALDKYEMRKVVTRTGLELAERYSITKEEILALHEKHGWNDDAMYQDLIANRQDLWKSLHDGGKRFCDLHELAFKEIRAALCPHFDLRYNWMDYPEKAGFPEIPNIDSRPYDWRAEQ